MKIAPSRFGKSWSDQDWQKAKVAADSDTMIQIFQDRMEGRYLRFIREILNQAEANGELPQVGDFGAYVFALFHLAMITHWLQDDSPGKENTLALLDRSLKVATRFLVKGEWDW